MSDPLGREDFERWIAAADALRGAVQRQTQVMVALDARMAALSQQLQHATPGQAASIAQGLGAAFDGLQSLRDLVEGPPSQRRRRR